MLMEKNKKLQEAVTALQKTNDEQAMQIKTQD